MTRRPLALTALALATLLPACKREAAPDTAAAGQILPGSASDAMLPVDRTTSQPPLDPRADRGSAKGGEDKGSATEAAGAEDGAAKPAPVAGGTGAAD